MRLGGNNPDTLLSGSLLGGRGIQAEALPTLDNRRPEPVCCFRKGIMAVSVRQQAICSAIELLGPADHVCTLYDRREEEVAIAVSFLRTGLQRGEQCVCVVDDGGASILGALGSAGVDVDTAMRESRLALLEKPLSQGLGPQQMLGWIDQHAGEARSAGHAGFRIVGEMTWALGDPASLRSLAEFEARLNLNRVWSRHACIGLCQFDRRRFSPEALRELLIVHPLVVVGDRVCRNSYHVPAEWYLSPDWPRHEVDWMMTNFEQLQRALDALSASEERYRSLSHRLLEVQEHERSSLARELHDQFGQSLVGVALNLQVIKDDLPPASRARVPESIRLIEQMLEQVRTLAFELRPSALNDLGLVPALRLVVARHGERTGVPARFTATPAEVQATAGIETACFRIAQEALANVARHARARHVEMTLAMPGDTLEIAIRDDGVGFDVERRRKGLGLTGMSERAALAGGQLEIDSEPGAGTTLRARFPLTPAP
jgi:signal transduction histidine kinase